MEDFQTFKDCEGHEYCPRVSALDIENLEHARNVDIYAVIFRMAQDLTAKNAGKDKAEVDGNALTLLLFEYGEKLFGNCGALMHFLFDACRKPGESVIFIHGKDDAGDPYILEYHYEDFASRITADEHNDALLAGVNAILDWLPEPLKGEGGGRPFVEKLGHLLGKIFGKKPH